MFSKKKGAALILAGCLTAASFTGCSFTDNMALVKIDGGKDKITYGYGNFYARLTQAMYDIVYSASASKDSLKKMWSQTVSGGTDTMEKTTKDQVLDGMKSAYYLRKHASDYDVKLTSAEKKKITKAAKSFMKANSKAAIKQLGATQEYAEEYLTNQYYTEKMRDAIENAADTTVSDEEANMKTIEYVFYSDQITYDSSGNMQVPTNDDIEKYKAASQAISESSDFDAAVTAQGTSSKSYSYDAADYKKAKKDGKASVSSSDNLPYEVLKAVDKLSDGQITSVIHVKNDGYYVATMKSSSDQEQTASNRTTLQEQKKTDFYNDTLKKYEAKSTWKVNKHLWSQVRFIDRFKGSLVQQSSGSSTSGTTSDTSESTGSTGSTIESTGDSENTTTN